MLLELIALSALGLILYHHLVYPLLLKCWARKAIRSREQEAANLILPVSLPSITLVIPAYNEAAHIAEKIANLGFVDYPACKLRIIVACDGCTDQTAQLARKVASQPENSHLNLKVHEFEYNRGKVAVLNQVLALVDTPWVALSDVSALLSIDAFQLAARHMSQPDVGVICSHYKLLAPGSEGEAAYWEYQSQIKAGEGMAGGTIGAHGACYLFRREPFQPMAADTINDDFILPMMIVAKGYRSVYEPDLHAVELETASCDMEQTRRRRIAAGNLQQAWRLRQLLMPSYGALAFNFFSGKCLRVLMPFLLFLLLPATLTLSAGSWFWSVVSFGQLLAYLVATCVHFVQEKSSVRPEQASRSLFAKAISGLMRRPKAGKAMKLVHYLVAGHLAGLIGSMRYLLGMENGHWQRVSQ